MEWPTINLPTCDVILNNSGAGWNVEWHDRNLVGFYIETQKELDDFIARENNAVLKAPRFPLYMCASCEAIYQDKVTECDCTVGEAPTWIEGFATFQKQNK
jgi:chromosome condensin MukBEF MukE localization factor